MEIWFLIEILKLENFKYTHDSINDWLRKSRKAIRQ
jgi:uncharacterized protein YehS (DUF1456 family)